MEDDKRLELLDRISFGEKSCLRVHAREDRDYFGGTIVDAAKAKAKAGN